MSFARAALHLGGLWALALAQPLLDLLGRNAEFFVARGSTPGDILVFAFGYTLLPPLAGALLVWGLSRIRPALGWGAMLVLVALLVTALLLPPVGDLLGGSAFAVPVALALGAGAAALYARAGAVRSFVTVLSPAPLVVLFLFLVVSPVRGLLSPAEPEAVAAGPAHSATPIVHVVLDELPEATLMGADGRIDPKLFPNLARLARESTWYRNATTVDDLTSEAVPAQLTGEQPHPGSLPTTRGHPRSLFTLFARSHAITAVEPITDVCPDNVCADARPGMLDRLSSLRSDLRVVEEHLLLPADLRKGLPAIDRVWEGFEAPAPDEFQSGRHLKRDVLARLARSDATAGFERAIAALDQRGPRPPLLFVHSTLPHAPYHYLPDGRRYDIEGKEFPGLASKGWIGPQWQVDQAFQRHVLQVQYVDRLVGRLLDALRAHGLYDDAVIVVAADHGAAFTTGEPRRPANRANAGSIVPVPFFVKLPGQHAGRVDDGAVRTTDVLPTLAQAAGVTIPWRTAGRPAAERGVDPSAAIAVTHAGEPALRAPLRAVLAQRRARQAVEAQLLRHGVYGVGPRPDLLGRQVPDARSGASTLNVDPEADVVRSFLGGPVPGARANALVAVAVNGRVAATTRVYRDGGKPVYAALVPPAALRPGRNAIGLFAPVPGGTLRPLG